MRRRALGALLLAAACAAARSAEPLAVRVLPQRLAAWDGPFRIGFQAGAAAVTNEAALAALRDVAAGAVVAWPAAGAAAGYNWYDGVGPRAARRGGAAGGPDFGTAEVAAFCRAVGAEPLFRAALLPPAAAGSALPPPRPEEWAAYCNAPSNHPLARLRARHGLAAPLGVRRWELLLPAGAGEADAARLAAACRETAAALRAVVPALVVSVAAEDAGLASRLLWGSACQLDGVACGSAAAGAAVAAYSGAAGRRAAWTDTRLAGAPDRYVGEVLRRLAGDAEARGRFGAWYEALALMQAALARFNAGCAGVSAALDPGGLLEEADGATRLSEAGCLLALFNRYPAREALAVRVAAGAATEEVQAAAGWTGDAGTLVVYLCHAGPEPRAVRLELQALQGRFAFWSMDQLGGGIARPAARGGLRLLHKRKSGSALPQAVTLELLPASFARVIVKP